MNPAYDAAIVGGGVIGCATAWELARRGLKVVLLERDRIGSGATGAAAGMLAPQSECHSPDAWLRLLLAARDGYAEVAQGLLDESGIDVEYRRDGVIRVAFDEPERAELLELAAWQRGAGLAAEWLEPAEARLLEPGLSPDLVGAVWLPDEAQVRPRALVRALATAAVNRGATLLEGVAVMEVGGDSVTTSTGRISAGAVVLSAGAWTGGLAGVPVGPVKGQMFSATVAAERPVRHMLWGPAYLAPKIDGQLFVGATQEGSWDVRPTADAIESLLAAGARLLPELPRLPIQEAWAGLRPATPDRKPLLGRLDSGVFIASGHFRNGILLGPLTGRLMAELVLGQAPSWDLSPYAPERLAAVAA